MIRKLAERDRAITLNFLAQEPAINLFMIGDLEAFGFDTEFQEFWGQFDRSGELEGVLLRFRESYIPYFRRAGFDTSGFLAIIAAARGRIVVSGRSSVIAAMTGLLPGFRRQEDFFCELRDGQLLPPDSPAAAWVKLAGEADSERVAQLIDQIDEFAGSGNSAETIRHKIATRTGRIYYIENEAGEIVSVAQSTAENSQSAMVVGVATLPEYRNRGYVSACMIRLCQAILAEGKTLCLFYDNPDAGRIYHRLGFQTIDKWVMIKAAVDE
jgi:uncharacterized protein